MHNEIGQIHNELTSLKSELKSKMSEVLKLKEATIGLSVEKSHLLKNMESVNQEIDSEQVRSYLFINSFFLLFLII